MDVKTLWPCALVFSKASINDINPLCTLNPGHFSGWPCGVEPAHRAAGPANRRYRPHL